MTAIDRQPELVTPSLLLRPMRAADWDALYAVASDPLIWAVHPSPDRWQEPVFRRYFDEGMAGGGALVVIDRRDGNLIGASRYDLARTLPGELEIGWTFLARPYWGGAANAQVKRAMIAHGLRFVETIIFLVGEHNLRSRRAMEKIGGRLTPRILDPNTGTQGRHVVYAINRAEFAAGPLQAAGSNGAQ